LPYRSGYCGESEATLTEATLKELAQQLVELREHLEQVRIGLSRATSGVYAGASITEESSLRCHTCGRTRSTDEAGWTLRLCGDDELHPFCPDCDRRHVNGHNGSGHAHTPLELGRDQPGD
jgi:hypothetical protein